jgi:8-oxo-dGTP pyrophosphatase MutT (NUDIX family)
MPPRLATTVLLVRGGERDLEVFMVQRHRRSGFLPNAWVFPGGRVDPGDHLPADHPALVGGAEVIEQLGLPDRDLARAHVVAGVRETWEEVGIWLGTSPPPDEQRLPVCKNEVPLLDVLPDDATMHLDELRAWSWWVTPEAEPKRYDTRFLIARADDHDGRHDDHETVDSRWVRPAEALQLGVEAFPLAPPTWYTLTELARLGTAEAAFADAATRRSEPIQPVMEFGETGLTLFLPGHRHHPAPAQEHLPHRITWSKGAWVGWRDGRRM